MADRDNVKIARNEMLIMIDYLLNETDEDHLSRVDDIVSYAQKNYQTKIDKRRVSECLEYLKDLNDRYPDKFPFILYESVGLQRKKYYIEQREFSKEDIYYICSAIKNDRYTGPKESNRLIDAILDATTNRYNNFAIRGALDNKFKNVNHYSDEVARLVHKLDSAKVGKNIICFDTVAREDLCFGESTIGHFDKVISHRGYVYNVVDYDRSPVLIFIDFQEKKLQKYEVRKIKNLKIEEVLRTKKANEEFTVDSVFESNEYVSPAEELKDISMPEKNGKKCLARFIFEARQVYIDSISDSFKQFFGYDLPFTIDNIDDKPYAKCEVNTNTITFMKWATNYDIIILIKITGDDTLRSFYDSYLKLINR